MGRSPNTRPMTIARLVLGALLFLSTAAVAASECTQEYRDGKLCETCCLEGVCETHCF